MFTPFSVHWHNWKRCKFSSSESLSFKDNRDSRHGFRAGQGSIQQEALGLGCGKKRCFHTPFWRFSVHLYGGRVCRDCNKNIRMSSYSSQRVAQSHLETQSETYLSLSICSLSPWESIKLWIKLGSLQIVGIFSGAWTKQSSRITRQVRDFALNPGREVSNWVEMMDGTHPCPERAWNC